MQTLFLVGMQTHVSIRDSKIDSYYTKTAHAQGGTFVLKSLAKSLGINLVGGIISSIL